MKQSNVSVPAVPKPSSDVAQRLQETFGALKAIINQPTSNEYHVSRKKGYVVVSKKRQPE